MKVFAPNYTQTPNDLFDSWLPHLNESELKVLLVIMRKTFGWHKVRDRISISQLVQITGQCERSVSMAVKSLVDKGIVYKEVVGEVGRQMTFYELRVDDSNNSYPPKIYGGTPLNSTGGTPLNFRDTKETDTKEKNDDDSDAVTGGGEPAKAGMIRTTNPKGDEVLICESDLRRRTARWNYSPAVMNEAIARLKRQTGAISDVYKYLEATCKNIVRDQAKEQPKANGHSKAQRSNAPKVDNAPPKVEAAPVTGPRKTMIDLMMEAGISMTPKLIQENEAIKKKEEEEWKRQHSQKEPDTKTHM